MHYVAAPNAVLKRCCGFQPGMRSRSSSDTQTLRSLRSFLNRSVFSRCPGWMGRRGRGNFVLKNCRSSFKFPPSFLSNRSSLYIFIKVETIERMAILLFLLFLKTPPPRSFQSCRNRFDARIENLENLPLRRGGRSQPIKISD